MYPACILRSWSWLRILDEPLSVSVCPPSFPFPQKFEQEGQGKYLILLTPAYSCSQGAIKGDQDFLAGPAVLDSPDGQENKIKPSPCLFSYHGCAARTEYDICNGLSHLLNLPLNTTRAWIAQALSLADLMPDHHCSTAHAPRAARPRRPFPARKAHWSGMGERAVSLRTMEKRGDEK